MSINLTCPCCRRTVSKDFSQGEAHIIETLAKADDPLTAPEIVAGGPFDFLSFASTLSRLKPKLEAHGYRIINVTGHKSGRGQRARYRLEKTEG